MKNYLILDAECFDTLASRVSFYLEDGYIPTGGVTIFGEGKEKRFYQAIYMPDIKKKKLANDEAWSSYA